MLIYAALIGIGYGAFMSVDMALMTQVLPKADGEATGKDLGILTTAVNIPQILSPVFAAWLLNLSGGDYTVLFIAAIIFVYAGSFLVLPIRSVKKTGSAPAELRRERFGEGGAALLGALRG